MSYFFSPDAVHLFCCCRNWVFSLLIIDRGDPIFPPTFNLITDYFFFLSFGRKNSGEVKRNIEAKMPSEFLGKKNCPYPLRGLIHYESYFFYIQYIQMYIQMYIQIYVQMYRVFFLFWTSLYFEVYNIFSGWFSGF